MPLKVVPGDIGAFDEKDIVEDTTPQLGGSLDAQGNDITGVGVITLVEQAAAEADVAGRGQVWIKTATPNEIWFTNDAGTDFQVGTLAGTETLTNKTIDADGTGNSITNIEDANIKAAAAIAVDKLAALTASELVSGNASGFLVSLAVASYPSLTEIAYVKGVTSAIQAQIDAKLANVVEDTSPQLGGALDGQGNDLNNLGVAFLTEQAAAETDVAGKGQLWIKTATPNQLWFTDDAGTDFQVASLAGTESLSNKTLTTPTISATGFSNAGHAHAAANSGGTVAASALSGTSLASGVVTTSATTVAALDAGSITSNFGTINNGASTITTTGTVSTGALSPSGTITHTGAAHNHELDGSGAVSHLISNTGTDENDVAYLELKTAGNGGGAPWDVYTAPHIRYTQGGSTYDWYTGVDLSQYNEDAFYIGTGTTVGATDAAANDSSKWVIRVVGNHNSRNAWPALTVDHVNMAESSSNNDINAKGTELSAWTYTQSSNFQNITNGTTTQLDVMPITYTAASAFALNFINASMMVTPPIGGGSAVLQSAVGLRVKDSGSSNTTTQYGIYMDDLSSGDTDVGISMADPLVFRGTAANHIQNVSRISFPATQSASTDANTLDDYEEGTWTPGIADDTGNTTGEGQAYTYQVGRYVKIGQKVWISGSVAISDIGTMAVGNGVQVRGLPFTHATLSNERSTFHVGDAASLAITAGTSLAGTIYSGGALMYINYWSLTSGSTALRIDELSAGGAIFFSGMYEAA